VSILCYHAVDPDWDSPLAVSPRDFREHCQWLAEHRSVVDLPTAVREVLPSGALPGKMTTITFDDGFASLYEHALPTLIECSIPATVFLVAGTLGRGGSSIRWTEENGTGEQRPYRTLSRSQVLEMQAAGVRFASHSYAHRDLTMLEERQCVEDLRASRQMLEDLLGQEVTFLAYPFGRHADHVRRAAETTGFEYAFATSSINGRVDRFSVPRIGVYASNGIATLRAKTTWYLPFKRHPLIRAVGSRKRR
jgi:peptidoglycan/xylan/chitin deacetylase (PgdA/CDA1 family)